MTDKVLFPSAWDNLTADDQELAKELTQSILRGEKSTQLLLQLLNNETIDDEFREEVKKISNHTFDFDIITLDDKQENIETLMPTDEGETPNLKFKATVFALAKRQCDNLCRNANTPEKIKACKKCLAGL
ncbi:MAG: hypothetical protein ACK57R_06605 [Dolichospermum sp.]|jgi:hypothetical protein|nr:hypothetical protein [Anabaena sp. 49628_E55]